MFTGIDHVGVVVRDLSAVAGTLGRAFDLPRTRELALPDQHLRAAFFAGPGFDLEIIQVDDPDIRRRRLGDGSARIEHVALNVDDVRATARVLAQRGVRFTAAAGSPVESDQPLVVGATSNLFTRPDTTGGVIFQLIGPA